MLSPLRNVKRNFNITPVKFCCHITIINILISKIININIINNIKIINMIKYY